MSKKRIIKKVSKIFLWTIGSLIGLFFIILVLVGWILSPSQLTPLAEKYANEYLDADVKIGKAELTIWKTFPYVTVDVDSLQIVSHAFKNLSSEERGKLPLNSDTLLVADRFHGGVNVLKIMAGIIDVRDVLAESAVLNFVAYSPELSNANIVAPSEDDSSSSEMPDIRFNSVELSRGNKVRFFSLSDSIDSNLTIDAMQFVNRKDDNYQFLFDGTASVRLGEIQSLNKMPLSVTGNLDWSFADMLNFDIENWNIHFGEIPLTFNLKANLTKDIRVDKFNFVLGEFYVNEIRKYVAKEYVSALEGIETNCRGTLEVELVKPYVFSEKILPSLKATFEIPDSYLKDSRGQKLECFKMSAEADFNGENINASIINVKNLLLKGRSIYFAARGKVYNIATNPHASGAMECNVDLAKAINVFRIPIKDEMVNGVAEADMNFNVKVNDIVKKYYDKIKVSGNLVLKDLAVKAPSDTFDLFVDRAKFFFGSSEKDELNDSIKGSSIFKASFSVDSLNLDYNGMNLNILQSMVSLGGKGNLANFGKKGYFVPVGAEIKAKKIKFRDVDSTQVRFVDLVCQNVLKQSDDIKPVPMFDFIIKSGRANYRDSLMRTGLVNGDIFLRMKPRVNAQTRRIDSLHNIYPKMSYDSLVILAENDHRAVYDNPEDSARDRVRGILNRWDLSGHVKAKKARMLTPYFPIRNRIRNLDMAFSMDSIVINSGRYKTGRSEFELEGGLRNLRSTIMGQKELPLKMNLVIYSDTLDVNEILTALYAGSKFSNGEARNILISDADDNELEQQLTSTVAETDTTMSAVLIPSNIEADIDVFAHYGRYTDLKLQDMSGGLQLRKGALYLNELRTNSDVGNLRFNALYSAPKKDDIYCAFDLALDGIKLDKFVKLVPSVDSIMPLLNSMEGTIRADIAATTKVDSSMNIIFPSLTAVMKLHGDSLVLFDSETFRTISKLLMFKNKKRNLIDNMTVEIVIKDNVMELFPFMFNMDRYKIGIMGSNDLNLNFKYHISVLKSPIPFKFGLNLSGNPDKWKFRFGGAKFKEGRAGRMTTIVEDTRINLREQMNNAFRRGARAAIKTNLDEHVKSNKLDFAGDTLSAQDSLKFIQEGLLEGPKLTPKQLKEKEKADRKAEKEREKKEKEAAKNKDAAIKKD